MRTLTPMSSRFIHLHLHTEFSLADSTIRVPEKPDEGLPSKAKRPNLVSRAVELQAPALAVTDRNNLFALVKFYNACEKVGMKAIAGADVSVIEEDGTPWPITLLCRDHGGYLTLSRLLTRAWLEGHRTDGVAIDPAWLREDTSGLFGIIGRNSQAGRLAASGRHDLAEQHIADWQRAFDDSLHLELTRTQREGEEAFNAFALHAAAARGLPVIASNDVRFLTPEGFDAHEARVCIASGRVLDDPKRPREYSREQYLKSAEQMAELFADVPDAIDNTWALAQRCNIELKLGTYFLPAYPVPDEETLDSWIRSESRRGLDARLEKNPLAPGKTRQDYVDRLEFELDTIIKMGFPGYFLIVADFIQWAKAQDIPVGPGRGSGAGSVAAWALTITDLDPMQFGLLFERFLNPERVSMPDFDIDFCQDRRDEVINYVRREYGEDRVGQIITFGRLQAKAVVRDVGRVMGMPYGQVNKIAELIPFNPAKPVSLRQAIDGEPRLQELQKADETVARLMETALELEGLYRNASTHAAGVVIGRKPLIDIVPLYRDPRAPDLVTQYSMKYVESASLVKFDFLGLKTLTVLQRAVQMLAKQGIEVDLARIPLDDTKTYEMLARGDSASVFQFESQGMRDVLRMMRPDRFEDLIAAVSLYRPGPMANIPAYCARKHGEAWDAPHPKMRRLVEETYGILVYQEQVMQISQELAGYSLGGADLLRRAMGKKNRAEMEAQRKIFVEGAVKNDVPENKAGEIFDLMEKFAEYGFNKSHAAAYALVAYQTAWLKANYPEEFLAASMSLDLGNTDKLAGHMGEASRLGIKVLPPDVNRSEAEFSVEIAEDGGKSIRFALAAVKRVGLGAMRDLVASRKQGGPFRSLVDFASRVDPKLLNKMQLENLARAGAFECLDRNRARVMYGAEAILRRAQSSAEERTSDQIGLFGGVAAEEAPLRLPERPDWPTLEKLAEEAEAIGFHLSAHPLDSYKEVLAKLRVTPIARMEAAARGGAGVLKLAGTVVGTKERTTKTGSRMAWVRISDSTGSTEVTCFSEVLSKSREILKEGQAVIFAADVRMDGDALRLTASSCESLDQAASAVATGIRILVAEEEAVHSVAEILRGEGKGKSKVVLVPCLGETQEVEITVPGTWNVSPRLTQRLRVLPGVTDVRAA